MTIQTPKQLNEVEEFNLNYIDINSILNSLEFYKDSDNFIIYNPMTSLSFDVDLSDLPIHEVKDMRKPRWDLVSYQIYGVSEYWYLIAQLNEITDIITQTPSNGDFVYYIEEEYINSILEDIKNNA